jgi:hypothetical protein
MVLHTQLTSEFPYLLSGIRTYVKEKCGALGAVDAGNKTRISLNSASNTGSEAIISARACPRAAFRPPVAWRTLTGNGQGRFSGASGPPADTFPVN